LLSELLNQDVNHEERTNQKRRTDNNRSKKQFDFVLRCC
jgi:hypothetical protein